MIAICELYHREEAHVPFNAGMIEVVRLAFPEEKIIFFGEPSHVEQVQKQLGSLISASVCWETISLPPQNGNYFLRLFSAMNTVKRLQRSLGPNSNSRLIFTSISPATLIALKLMGRLVLKDMPIQVVSHGEIKSGVIGKRHRHPWRRFKEMRTAMSLFSGSSIQYLVLEHGIRERILQALPLLAGKIEVLEHPLPPNESNSHARKMSRPIHFGFLGLANEMKGFSTFLHLAAEMATKHPGKAEFHVIGRLEPGVDSSREMEFLTTKPGLERLSRHEYIERVKRLHYIIMPYRLDYYELSPSGTLLDAIAWEVPVIASKLPIFERTFGTYGNVGYLFGNEKDLHAIVEDLAEEMDESGYARQVSNLRKARLSRTPEKLAAVFREICNRGVDSQHREFGALKKIA
jgi:glycosyltransferase involved in cell wall biosynthesis